MQSALSVGLRTRTNVMVSLQSTTNWYDVHTFDTLTACALAQNNNCEEIHMARVDIQAIQAIRVTIP